MDESGVSVAELTERLTRVELRDERRLMRRLRQLPKDPRRRPPQLAAIAGAVTAAEGKLALRRAALPAITYPPALPVSQRRDDIAAAIAAHQVVVVAGETGSGKTTQLPKICLELGRGVRGRIGHTQPRRIAARTVAERIASELGVTLGGAVGYSVRFTDDVSDATSVKLMTDGILLAEIQRDPLLLQYDTLIVDEAHERSLTIDFILGYLRTLLPRRPDLKVIITSATIDPARFSAHFHDAPVIEVSGRTFPVEIRYRPLLAEPEDDDEFDDIDERTAPARTAPRTVARDPIEAIADAVTELGAESQGDILVFLSGEREIRDTADALSGLELRNTEVVPLYGRLSAAEQHRVFAAHTGRRIVLATNVAETSLTVPGIRYVIDPGTARISRYSNRTKVQRLPIEPISQASANQRSGRCGRTSDGICIRLYSEADYDSRPEFTEPEILRTSLASVILRMASLGLGDIAAFPFIDPPDRRSIRDGVTLLHELGALDVAEADPDKALTAIGRRLAQLPIDPQLGRMVLEADTQGCVTEVLVVAAALSIQDPRERPLEHREAAAQLHARFADEHSDFATLLALWAYLREQQHELSGNQFRRLCRAEYLHYLRIREWQDLVSQLRRVTRSLGITENSEPASPGQVHTALLSGLLSHVGVRDGDKREYLGARNARFVLSPGSALAKKPPKWVVAAELVETSRLYARVAARTDPETVERLAAHLVVRTYSEPRWDSRRAAAVATERVTLYGLPLVTGRSVAYGGIDPVVSRELFLQHALVEGDWQTRHHFFHDNARLLADIAELENRTRRRDVVVDDTTLADFYRDRIPPDVVSGRHFDAWWKKERHVRPDLLTFTRELLLAGRADVSAEDYPDVWTSQSVSLPLTYRFEPGAPDDGVTIHVPLDVLNRVDPDDFDWQVPALREELVTALLRSLPKALRRELGPAPDRARALLADITPGQEPMLVALERAIHEQTGVVVPRSAWDLERLPSHLRTSFVIEDDAHRVVARGRDLAALRQELAIPLQAAVAGTAHDLERSGLRDWDLGELPRTVERTRAGNVVQGFPALVDDGDSVSIRVLTGEQEQAAAMRTGVRRLLLLTIPSPAKSVQNSLAPRSRLALSTSPDGPVPALLTDCVAACVDDLVQRHGGVVWDAAAFAQLRERVRGELPAAVTAAVADVERVLTAAREADAAVPTPVPPALAPALADIAAQRAALLYPGFVTAIGRGRLRDLARYLQAIAKRLERLPREAELDAARMDRVHRVEQVYNETRQRVLDSHAPTERIDAVRWMIEELRVSLFAQTLGTAHPVSEQRIYRALDTLGV